MRHETFYKSYQDLHITAEEYDALQNVRRKLSSGEIDPMNFDMRNWCSCIRHHVELDMGKYSARSPALDRLYRGNWDMGDNSCWQRNPFDGEPTNIDRCSNAINRFLTGSKVY